MITAIARGLIPLGTAGLMLAGCSDPKAPSKANFKAAINKWGETSPVCFALPDGDVKAAGADDKPFPIYVDQSPSRNAFDLQNRKRLQDRLDTLVAAGALRASAETIKVKLYFSFDNKLNDLQVRAYNLSDEGTKALRRDVSPFGDHGRWPSLCYGTPTVDEIVEFSEPNSAMGMTVSEVSYTYHLKDVPSWARDARINQAFPEIAKAKVPGRTGKTSVILMNDGWKDSRH